MKTNSSVMKRKLTPDLARGFMLLFIALAHANQFIFSTEREITVTDQLTVFIRQVLVPSLYLLSFLDMGYIKYSKAKRGKGTVGRILKKYLDVEEHGC
jgi:hypothetical protein